MELKKINKKADQLVLPESLKLVIAVMCLLLLIYLAWNLYSLTVGKSKLAQARETLKQIVEKINVVKEGQDKYMVVAPKGWYLLQNEDRMCMCSKDYVNKIKDTCCLNGALEKLSKEVFFDSFCPDQKVDSCLNLNNVPLDIYFTNKDGKVKINTEYSLNSDELFNSLLEFRSGEKSIKELCQGYVDKTVEKSEVISKVKEFFAGEKNGIIFQIIKTENQEELITLPLSNSVEVDLVFNKFNQEASDKTLAIKDSEGKEYDIVLKIGEFVYIGQVRGM